jgi:hypothetical protein
MPGEAPRMTWIASDDLALPGDLIPCSSGDPRVFLWALRSGSPGDDQTTLLCSGRIAAWPYRYAGRHWRPG